MVLLALLQRVPVLRLLVAQSEFVLEKPGGEMLKSVVACTAALGAVQTLAGATTFTPTAASPASATVGTAASFAFAVTGAPSAVKSWTITGSVPPGLLFYATSTATTGGVSTGTVNTTTLYLHGTPTTSGGYTFTLKAWEKTGGTGNVSPNYSYTINVTGSSAVAPTITTQPQNVTVTAGAAASFTVAASGTAPLSYQWKKDAVDIASATSATYSIAAAQASDAGSYSVVVSNSAGNVTSTAATLTVNAAAVAPTITTQPSSVTVTEGASASFTVAASGTAPLTYQWKKGTTAISGATSATYTINPAQTTDAGSYSVVVSNSVGNVTSTAATLTVNAAAVAPTITTQPSSVTVTAGASASFTVAASGTAPLTYQWKKGTTTISGATSSTYTINPAQTTDAGNYSVVVSNAVGNVTSSSATLTVTVAAVAPSITTQPQSVTANAGTNVSFSVVAAGTAPLSYQWKKDTVNISGATSASLSISNIQSSDAATYTVVVTNSAGSVTSTGAVLTISASAVAPTISTQPQSLSVTAGADASFTVAANGTSPFTYQWKKGGVNVSGATADTLTIKAAQSSDAGDYTVVVTNAAGSVTSAVATLTVAAAATAPTITTQPQGASVAVGGKVTFTVTAAGTAPLSYQWKKDSVNITGATSASYTIDVVQSTDAGNFTVSVSNSAGSVTSSAATLSVTTSAAAPTITSQPQSADILVGTSVALSVTASGSSLTYQWKKDGVAIPAATGASYVFGAVQPTDAGTYTVTVSNSQGSVNSSGATLTVRMTNSVPNGAARLVNISTRSAVGTGSEIQIAGFVIEGSAPKTVLIRASGQALATANLTGYLADPVLRLFSGQSMIAQNDDWNSALAPTFSQLGAQAWTAGSTDAAMLISLQPGAYTAQVTGKNNTTGIALIEVYEADGASSASKLINLSTRSTVGTGANIHIVGFVINGNVPKKLVIRAGGPSLTTLGVAGVLEDPVLRVLRDQNVIMENDDWNSSLTADFAAVGAMAWPVGSKDAAVAITLAPGVYTAHVFGKNGGTGVGLVEIYEEN